MRTRFSQGDRTIESARRLRRESTPAEDALWAALRGSRLDGWKFRRQQRMGADPRYCADFVCYSARLIIELDGESHAHSEQWDARRTVFLNEQGYRVLRFWNNEVMGDLDGVYETIQTALAYSSSLRGEGGARSPQGEWEGEGSTNTAPYPHPSAALSRGSLPLPQGERET